jgi:hypothetical protein
MYVGDSTSQNFTNYTDSSNNKTYSNAKKNLSKDDELTQDERRSINELQARDAEVKAHESAHQAAGGGMVGGASFTYQQGPDGKMYAIGGEVPISMPSGSTPEEIIANAQQIIASATAPADPSAQDVAVASSARSMIIEAEQQKREKSLKEQESKDKYNLDTTA